MMLAEGGPVSLISFFFSTIILMTSQGLELLQRAQCPLFPHSKIADQRVHSRNAARQITGGDCVSCSTIFLILVPHILESEVVGEYGQRPLYRMLGYFSIIGLLRVHVLLGDFTLALKVMDNVELNQKVRRQFFAISY